MTNIGGGAGTTRGGGGGTLIPTLTFTPAEPLSKAPVSARSVVPASNVTNIAFFMKCPPFTVALAPLLLRRMIKANGQIAFLEQLTINPVHTLTQ